MTISKMYGTAVKKNDLDFTGKTAIVTGGRRGIGRAIALAYAEHGAEVAVIAKNHDGSGILADLEKTGTPGHYFSCDIGDESSRRGLIAEVVKQFQKIGSKFNTNTLKNGFLEVALIQTRGLYQQLLYRSSGVNERI